MDRLAASPQIVEAIVRQQSPAVDPVDQLQGIVANYQSKGLSPEVASVLAAADLRSGHRPAASRRFELLNADG